MSQNVVRKEDIDALVSVALAWGGLPLPSSVALRAMPFWEELSVDPTAAGSRLWRENFDNVVYGGDPDLMDEAERTWLLEEEVKVFGDLPSYEFEPMPGTPTAPAGLQVISYYSYQTSQRWFDEGPTPISQFVNLLREIGNALPDAGIKPEGMPWGLGPDNRDFFLRF